MITESLQDYLSKTWGKNKKKGILVDSFNIPNIGARIPICVLEELKLTFLTCIWSIVQEKDKYLLFKFMKF